MMLSVSLALLSLAQVMPCTNALQQVADLYYHQKEYMGPAMWLFAGDGIAWYKMNGDLIKDKTLDSDHSCTPPSRYGGGCNFYDVATDGKSYVWAATMHTNSISMYDIDTGDKVAEVGSCGTPLDVKYHPGREELWTRCAAARGDAGHVDVVSLNSLHRQENPRLVSDKKPSRTNPYVRHYGRLEVSADMGGYGWASHYSNPYLSQFDLSSQEVINYPLPNNVGSYEIAYSKVNKHVYVAERICCSCGEDMDTMANCTSRAVPVNVTSGVNKGLINVPGYCSTNCKGTKADPGVQEFDTVSKKFIQAINCNPSAGYGGTPLGSPSGETVLLFPYDGGKTVRVITPQENGAPSTFDDANVDFVEGNQSRELSDAVFVKWNGVNAYIVASGEDNSLAIIDSTSLTVSKVVMSGRPEKTSNGDRQIHWAEGQRYVWVTGSAVSEIYIFKLDISNERKITMELYNTITARASKLLWVENYGREQDRDLLSTVYDEDDVEKSNEKSLKKVEELLDNLD